MMNYEIFKEVVKEKFMDYMPEKFKGMELVAEPVEKINVTLDGIILREEGRNISPTIYINDMYKKYQDCGDVFRMKEGKWIGAKFGFVAADTNPNSDRGWVEADWIRVTK